MLNIETNPDDFKTGNEARMDEQLMVRFFYKERQDKAASAKEGRPIFKEIEYVEIRVPGSRDAQACRPATHRDKNRFPGHYKGFKDRVAVPLEGTPLAEWTQVTRSQVENLAFMNVKTVEQLANLSDTHITKLQGGHNLKAKAAAWLESAGESKLLAEKEALEKRLADMEAKMAEMMGSSAAETIDEPEKDVVVEAPKRRRR